MKRLLLALALLLPIAASAQVTPGSPFGGGGSGGTFNGGDVSGQTNICGPDNATNVEIGSCTNDANAGTGGTSVVIGNGANNSGNVANVTLIGSGAGPSAPGAQSVGIGTLANPRGTDSVVVGYGGGGTAPQSIMIGRDVTSAFGPVVMLGYSTAATAANQFIAGGNGQGMLDVYFGEGAAANTSALGYTLRATPGSGVDNAGGGITIAPGIGTGTAVGGQVVLQRARRLASGSSAQPLVQSYIACPVKVLSNTSATVQAIATITTTTTTGGSVSMYFTTMACSGSTCDTDAGNTVVAWNNNAGTVAATMGAAYGAVDSDATGTLATTQTATVATNVVTINFTPTWVTIVPTTVWGMAIFNVNSGVDSLTCS